MLSFFCLIKYEECSIRFNNLRVSPRRTRADRVNRPPSLDYSFLRVEKMNRSLLRRNIQGLDCTLCGPSALITVMMVTKKMGARDIRILPYANSGDISGERHRVVGYGAAVFYMNPTELNYEDFSRLVAELLLFCDVFGFVISIFNAFEDIMKQLRRTS